MPCHHCYSEASIHLVALEIRKVQEALGIQHHQENPFVQMDLQVLAAQEVPMVHLVQTGRRFLLHRAVQCHQQGQEVLASQKLQVILMDQEIQQVRQVLMGR